MKTITATKRRKLRVGSKVRGTTIRPRISIFRSNKFLYIQLIDDQKQETLLGLSEKSLSGTKKGVLGAKELGVAFAKKAIDKKVKQVVFDRGSYTYHGKVKEVAEGLREGGLQF